MSEHNTPREQAEIAPATAATFGDIVRLIQTSRGKIFAQANRALMELYWQIGKTISDKVVAEAWGKGVVSELARHISANAPDAKGFSDKNLWRMKQFYETYRDDEKLSSLTREIPWTHNTVIFSRCKSRAERAFYLANPSIGVLLCRDKDDEVVEYALSRNLSPALVAEYQLQLPDKKLLQARLHELLPDEWPDPAENRTGESEQ